MTQRTQKHAEGETGTGRQRGIRPVRRWIMALALVGLGALGGALGSTAMNAGAHGGWRSGFGMNGHHRPTTTAQAIERVQRTSAWLLGSVAATDEQRARIDTILADTVTDIFPLRIEHHSHWRDLIAELARPDIDRDGLEQVRAAELALAEQATERLLNATIDIAGVLDREQRERILWKYTERWH